MYTSTQAPIGDDRQWDYGTNPAGAMVQTVWEEMPLFYPKVELDAFVLMPNHIRRLWQRNYYEHIIRNQQSCDRLRQYIVNNPLLWQSDSFHLDQEKAKGDRNNR